MEHLKFKLRKWYGDFNFTNEEEKNNIKNILNMY